MATEPTISVDFAEVAETRRESRSSTGFTASLTLECAWADRLTLQRELVGGVREQAGLPVYFLPASYPDDSSARVTSVELSKAFGAPSAGSGGYMTPTRAFMTVKYEYSTSSIGSGENEYPISDDFGESLEFITVPVDSAGNALYWVEQSVRVDADSAPGFQVAVIDWTRTISAVENIPSTVFTLAGNVNSAALRCPAEDVSLTFQPETLLYDGPSLRGEWNQDGDYVWEVTLNFGYRDLGTPGSPRASDVSTAGWNHYFRPGSTSAERMYTSPIASTIYRPYPLGNLTGLLGGLA